MIDLQHLLTILKRLKLRGLMVLSPGGRSATWYVSGGLLAATEPAPGVPGDGVVSDRADAAGALSETDFTLSLPDGKRRLTGTFRSLQSTFWQP
jgi:hypothetical protein